MKELTGKALIKKSAAIAEEWHDGQEHFFGDDSYFNMHLKPVANIIRRLGYGATSIATGYLHDIIEDTEMTYGGLVERGIPSGVAGAVSLMSKTPNQSHEQYINMILSDRLATIGKFADSSFNYAWTVLNSPNISDENFRDWSMEYTYNLRRLRAKLPVPPGMIVISPSVYPPHPNYFYV